MSILKHKWHNVAPIESGMDNAVAGAYGSLQEISSPAEKTYISPLVPQDTSQGPVVKANPVLTIDNSEGNVIISAKVNDSPTLQALKDVATSLGIIQPDQTKEISKDTIMIYLAAGVATIGILALILKS